MLYNKYMAVNPTENDINIEFWNRPASNIAVDLGDFVVRGESGKSLVANESDDALLLHVPDRGDLRLRTEVFDALEGRWAPETAYGREVLALDRGEVEAFNVFSRLWPVVRAADQSHLVLHGGVFSETGEEIETPHAMSRLLGLERHKDKGRLVVQEDNRLRFELEA